MKRSSSDSLTLYSYRPASTSITSISTTPNINNTTSITIPINKSLKRVKLEHEIFSTSIKDIELMFHPITIVDNHKDQFKFNHHIQNLKLNNSTTSNMTVPKYTTNHTTTTTTHNQHHHHHHHSSSNNTTKLNGLKYDCINLSLLSSISSSTISDEEDEEEDEEEEEEEEEFDEDDDEQFINDNTKVSIPILPSQTKSINNSTSIQPKVQPQQQQPLHVPNNSVQHLINYELNYLPSLSMTRDDVELREISHGSKFLQQDLKLIDELILMNH